MDCKWVISANYGKIVQLTFTLFDLEPSSPISGCSLDYVRVIDGLELSGAVIGDYCGTLSEFTAKSSKSFLTLVFHSNRFIERGGFIANYKILNAPAKDSDTGKLVPVPLIIAGVVITVLVIITIVCIAVSGKFSTRTRKRAQRQMSRSSLGSSVSMRSSTLGSRVTMRSSRTGLPHSIASLRSHKKGSPLIKSTFALPELIVTNEEGKQTRIFPEKAKTRAFVHTSPHSRRRHHFVTLKHRRLSAENIIYPTPPPRKRNMTAYTNWNVYTSKSGMLSNPTPSSPSSRRHSIGSVKGGVIT
ncbi:Cubilin [Exaiptasia diaphana]|nr:Cubilin [Exaiptasia diaphana]